MYISFLFEGSDTKVLYLSQDSVFFREEFPDHPIFQHPLFATRDYAVFADEIRRTCAQTEEGDPHGILVEKALPALGEKPRAVAGTIQSGNEATVTELRELTGKVDRLAEAVEDSLNSTVSFTFTPGRSRMVRDVGASRQREVSPSPAGRSFRLEPAATATAAAATATADLSVWVWSRSSSFGIHGAACAGLRAILQTLAAGSKGHRPLEGVDGGFGRSAFGRTAG